MVRPLEQPIKTKERKERATLLKTTPRTIFVGSRASIATEGGSALNESAAFRLCRFTRLANSLARFTDERYPPELFFTFAK
jgi:hypothetical protein